MNECVCVRSCSRIHLFCEGDGDVVGVVTPLRGVAQVVLHGVQVVEVGVRLKGASGQRSGRRRGRSGRSRKGGRRGQGETLMCDCADEVKTQGHLEPMRCE